MRAPQKNRKLGPLLEFTVVNSELNIQKQLADSAIAAKVSQQLRAASNFERPYSNVRRGVDSPHSVLPRRGSMGMRTPLPTRCIFVFLLSNIPNELMPAGASDMTAPLTWWAVIENANRSKSPVGVWPRMGDGRRGGIFFAGSSRGLA